MFTKLPRRIFIALTIIVSLSTLVSLLHYLQGPRVVDISEQGTIAEKVVIYDFNTQLNVNRMPTTEITPVVKHSLRIQNKRLILTFDEPLQYDTTYRLHIGEIADKRDHMSTIQGTLSTSKQSVTYLQRTGNGKDAIVKRDVGSPDSDRILFEYERIGDYALLERSKLLVLIDEKVARFQTTLLRIDDDKPSEIKPPQGTALEVVGSLNQETALVRTRNMDTLQDYLYEYDWSSNSFSEIIKKDGASIRASRAVYAPDGKTIVYVDAGDNALYVLDPLKDREDLNLGTVNALHRILPNGKGIFYESKPGSYERISTSGEKNIIIDDITVSESQLTSLLRPVFIRSAYSLTEPSQVLVTKNGENESVISRFDSLKESVQSLTLSPNDQYLSIITTPSPMVFDGYRVRPEAINSYTKIMDLEGMLIDSFSGTHLLWL